MSGEAAARNGAGIGGRWPAGAEASQASADAAAAADSPPSRDGGVRIVAALVSSGTGGAATEVGVEGVAEGADPRSVLDALLSAAADLIGQAIELHRGLEAVSGASEAEEEPDPSLAGLVADYERRLIEAALQRTHGNRAQAARLLRTTERILGYRVQRYGIDCEVFRG